MAYSKERKAKQMIAKLEKQLQPSAGRVVSSAEQRRIKNRISSLRQSVSTMSAAKGKPAAKKRVPTIRPQLPGKLTKPLPVGRKPAAKKPAAKKSAARKETSAQKTERRRREYNERKKQLRGTGSPSGGWMKKFFDFK